MVKQNVSGLVAVSSQAPRAQNTWCMRQLVFIEIKDRKKKCKSLSNREQTRMELTASKQEWN